MRMKKTWILLMGALALVLSACGGGTDTADDTSAEGSSATTEAAAEAVADGDKPTINLVVNAWTASALNIAVAAQLIESELGYEVEQVTIDENIMFTGLADGSLDAVLEVWPSGITADEQAFIDDGSVINIGELGAVGEIGWFVPSYVIEENPDLASWEGYASPDAAALFATASTGELGRFLGTDPSYSTFDEQIIANLGLPFDVEYSGSEATTVAELDARVAAGEPILMYWWTPTAAVAKYDLVKVELPTYTEECGASQASGDGGVDCEYPEDVLQKLASSALEEKAPDVWTFLQNFQLTSEDQLSMLPGAEIDQRPVEEVAAEWIAANEDVWSAWLP
jgi:glycine betaine/proline transport system substrate-binding protein